MTSGQIIGKMDTQKQLNVPLEFCNTGISVTNFPRRVEGVLMRGRSIVAQEAKNRPNIDWQQKIHGGILRGLRNISETP